MQCEVANRVSFSEIRYAQCWEDADVLLGALDVRPGQQVLSIASAGDNTLALLSKGPERVVALDLSAAQLACLELRVAAFRSLEHAELLELVGSRASARRPELYQRCRPELSATVRRFWDKRPATIASGIGGGGKFERYLALFRRRLLPLAHSRKQVLQLLQSRAEQARQAFFERSWNSWRWRALLRLFCSQALAGRFGRDPGLFAYAEGGLAPHLMQRIHHALTVLNPADNPYLQWILTGRHTSALPYALRAENFQAIRSHLDRLEWHCEPLERYLARSDARFDRYNLSDIFEYMSPANYRRLLERIVDNSSQGARLAYWNMLVPRSRPRELAPRLQPLAELEQRLHRQDRAFFYSRFVLEEVTQ